MRITSAGAKTNAAPTTNVQAVDTLKPRREIGIDVWRGIAVALMILTHAVAFFHIGDDPTVVNIGLFGGMVSFVLFLFLSGASAYFSYVKYESGKHDAQIKDRRGKILMRTLFVLLGYYLVAVVSVIPFLTLPPDASTWVVLFKVLTFQTVPPFTEFILAFIIFNLLIVLLRPVFNFLTKFPLILILLGIGLYVLGSVLWQIDLSEPFSSYKALFAGHKDLHTFPILQFSIVYLLGMSWGRFLFTNPNKGLRIRINLYAIVVAGLAAMAGIITSNVFDFNWIQPENRFPPSVSLIAIGLLSGYIIWYVVQITNNGKLFGPLQVLFHYMGSKAFDFFIFHTILLFAYSYITKDQRYDSSFVVFGLYLLLIAATFVVVAIFENTINSLKQASTSKSEYGWIFSERLIVSSIWVFVVVMIGLSSFQNQVSATAIDPEEVSFKKQLLRQEQWPFWWDNSYSAFRQITIGNNGLFPVAKGSWREFSFNHKDAVTKHDAKKSGEDVRVVYYNEEEDYFFEIPFVFNGINTANATVRFALQADITAGGSDDKYFIYYGNPDTDELTPANDAPSTASNEAVALGDEQIHRLNGKINKRWHLKEGISGLSVKTMNYTITLNPDLSKESIVTFNVVGTDIRGPMDNRRDGTYRAEVPVGDLKPGVYQVQAIAREPEDKLTLINSDLKTFFVSYPLYVVWTQDWEGGDVPTGHLDGLDQMANRYKIPMTHFFNPRIFVDGVVSKNRADALTLWVQDRAKDHNDEIGLHLHMWFDMVRAAGVTPRSGPAAPWLYGDGGGVLASAYTKAEMKRILNWSKTVFQDNGLVTPISFRAGGWFANEGTLEALAETGFLIDSSGRTKPVQRDLADPRIAYYPPPWNLEPTTQPYIPSRENMNKEGTPSINIWEFPNNGADSYWYTTAALIERFNANYRKKGSILNEPQVVNYLSHPPFFHIDKPRMEPVFNHIGRFLNRDDNGPVVYTTLENAYYGYTPWAREQSVINN